MRREYRHLLLAKAREKQFGYLFHQVYKLPLVWAGAKLSRAFTGPVQAVLIVTYRCNLRCRMCDLWQRPKEANQPELDSAAFKKVIKDLAALRTTGVGFTGGEPLLRKDLFQLIGYAHRQGLATHLATNGLLLNSKNIQVLLGSGLDALSVSLDGPTAAIHDFVRGKKGTFKKVLKNLRTLDARRRRSNNKLSVVVNCALSSFNAAAVLELVKKVPRLGVDSIGFIPVQPSGLAKRRSRNWPQLQIRREKKINKIIDELIRVKKKHPKLIDNTVDYLSLMKDFFAGKSLPIVCLVGYHTCVIDAYGQVFPCIPFSNLDRPFGNLSSDRLRTFWSSSAYQQKRNQIKNCRQCFWNCHTEVNLIFSKPKK